MSGARRIVVVLVVSAALIGSASLSAGVAATDATWPKSYPIRASFKVTYDVRWSEGTESNDPCEPWETEDGHLTVEAESVGRPQTTMAGLAAIQRPRLQVFYTTVIAEKVKTWADLHAVGEAEGTVRRVVVRQGGPSGCPGKRDYTPPRTDCRGVRHFDASLTRGPATLFAGIRPAVTLTGDTLDYTKHVAIRPVVSTKEFKAPFDLIRHTLLLVVKPDRPLYQQCATTRAAPEYPIFVGRDLAPPEWRRLARLQARQSALLKETTQSGDCTADDITDFECTYVLKIEAKITRVA